MLVILKHSLLLDHVIVPAGGVKEDWEIGYEYHINSANAGYAPAQFNVGTHYFMGQGIEQNFELAAKWFDKASKQNLSQASFNLGQMYLNGRGVNKDYKKGIEYMEHSSDLGNKDAKQVLIDIKKENERKNDDETSETSSTNIEEGVIIGEDKK